MPDRERVLRIGRRAQDHAAEDLPAEIRSAVEAVGIIAPSQKPAAAVAIAVAVSDAIWVSGGLALSAEGIEARVRRKKIRREFNGRNHRELAERHGVSVRTVRRIVARRSQ